MPRKPKDGKRIYEQVMDEFDRDQTAWDIEHHLNGCLAAYQTDPQFGTAVFFALEAIWGIANEMQNKANAGELGADELDSDWTIDPRAQISVPWIWIRALGKAWPKYRDQRIPLGHAFGLEGGQGKSPAIQRLDQLLDERAIARWVWERVRSGRAEGKAVRIEDSIQAAADNFKKSDVTIRRAWRRFGGRERQNNPI